MTDSIEEGSDSKSPSNLEKLLAILDFFTVSALEKLDPDFEEEFDSVFDDYEVPWNILTGTTRDQSLSIFQSISEVSEAYSDIVKFADNQAASIARLYDAMTRWKAGFTAAE